MGLFALFYMKTSNPVRPAPFTEEIFLSSVYFLLVNNNKKLGVHRFKAFCLGLHFDSTDQHVFVPIHAVFITVAL